MGRGRDKPAPAPSGHAITGLEMERSSRTGSYDHSRGWSAGCPPGGPSRGLAGARRLAAPGQRPRWARICRTTAGCWITATTRVVASIRWVCGERDVEGEDDAQGHGRSSRSRAGRARRTQPSPRQRAASCTRNQADRGARGGGSRGSWLGSAEGMRYFDETTPGAHHTELLKDVLRLHSPPRVTAAGHWRACLWGHADRPLLLSSVPPQAGWVPRPARRPRSWRDTITPGREWGAGDHPGAVSGDDDRGQLQDACRNRHRDDLFILTAKKRLGPLLPSMQVSCHPDTHLEDTFSGRQRKVSGSARVG